jgi:hypothetical protein
VLLVARAGGTGALSTLATSVPGPSRYIGIETAYLGTCVAERLLQFSHIASTHYAASGTKHISKRSSVTTFPRMKAKDLPIYDDPFDQNEYRMMPREPGVFQPAVARVRQAVQKTAEPYRPNFSAARTSLTKTREQVVAFQRQLAESPGQLGPLALIGVAGLTGIVLGHRRSALRRIVYASGLATVAAAFCFPQHAQRYAAIAYDETKKRTDELFGSKK